jgi:hypothetical protein
MQVNTVNTEELADLLEQSKILSIEDKGGVRQYVLEFDNQDILVYAGTDGAWVTYPPESFDAESGGSIHDHARASLADEICA